MLEKGEMLPAQETRNRDIAQSESEGDPILLCPRENETTN